MTVRLISQAMALCAAAIVGVFSPAHALTQQEPVAKLESAGYSQIRDIKSTAEGTAVRAMKNGKFSGGPISLIAPRPEIGLGPVVCPAKAGMFSRRQTCRGRSQSPVDWIAE